MPSKRISLNQREILSAQSTISGQQEYLTSTSGALNIAGSFSVTGGATAVNQTNGQQLVQIVDAGGEAATVTGGKLDVNATASLTGDPLPIAGVTTAVSVGIVDGSGNQITSFGGGSQYTDGSSTIAHPVGTIPVYDKAGTITAVSVANPLPVSASFSPSGTQDVNLTKVAGAAISQGHGTAATAIRVELPTDGTGKIATVDTITNPVAVTGTFFQATQPVSGTVTANQGTSPWVTQVTSVTPGSTNALLGAAVDSPATSTKVGVLAIAVRDDALTTLTPVDNDYTEMRVDSTGSHWVHVTNIDAQALPTGASTSALQTTGNTSLSSIDGKVPALGQALAAASVPVVLTAAQLSTLTPLSTVAVTQSTSPWVTSNATTSVVGNGAAATAQRVTLANDSTGVIATVGAVTAITNALPAGTNVIGHVITDTGSTTAVTGTVSITGTVTANAGTNLNTSLLALESGGNLASIKTNTDNLNLAQASTTSGQKGNLVLGATTTAAPTYTTAQSNPLSLTTTGLLRVDGSGVTQPVSLTSTTITGTVATTQSGTWTNTVTQATAANLNAQVQGAGAQNAAVTGNPVLAAGYASAAEPSNVGADGRAQDLWLDLKGRLVTTQQAGTATSSNVASSATNVTLLSSNTARKGATVYNDSTSSLLLKLGTTASATSFTVLVATTGYYEVPFGYSGNIDGIWTVASGSARIVELT